MKNFKGSKVEKVYNIKESRCLDGRNKFTSNLEFLSCQCLYFQRGKV